MAGDDPHRVACPESLPRPEGYTCDEYPFGGTKQGAFLNWGNVGYTIAFVTGPENSKAGGYLSGFFSNKRIIDADPFWVNITL